MCVETLKRDWDPKLTIRDVLVTISCLLIQPNPDSALNADAGALIQEDYKAFAKRARLMTGIHAAIPKSLHAAVKEAQTRGQTSTEDADHPEEIERRDFAGPSQSDVQGQARRRRITQRQRGAVPARRADDGSPSGVTARWRQQADTSNPFVLNAGGVDPFGISMPPDAPQQATRTAWDDDSFTDMNQENDEMRSPKKGKTPKLPTPRRPQGAPVPLGELTMDDALDTSSEMEAEYPPSPRKSPAKSPVKRQPQIDEDSIFNRPESSRVAVMRAPNITPPNLSGKPLAEDSPFSISVQRSPSPRKARRGPQSPGKGGVVSSGGLFGVSTPAKGNGVLKKKSPTSSEKRREEKHRRANLDANLWKLCGEDIGRWNRGDFDGEPFKKKAGRW